MQRCVLAAVEAGKDVFAKFQAGVADVKAAMGEVYAKIQDAVQYEMEACYEHLVLILTRLNDFLSATHDDFLLPDDDGPYLCPTKGNVLFCGMEYIDLDASRFSASKRRKGGQWVFNFDMVVEALESNALGEQTSPKTPPQNNNSTHSSPTSRARGDDPNAIPLREKLWGNYFLDLESGLWRRTKRKASEDQRGFCKYILQPLVNAAADVISGSPPIHFDAPTGLMMTSYLLPWTVNTTTSFLDFILKQLPSPVEAQPYRLEVLYRGSPDDRIGHGFRQVSSSLGVPLLAYAARLTQSPRGFQKPAMVNLLRDGTLYRMGVKISSNAVASSEAQETAAEPQPKTIRKSMAVRKSMAASVATRKS